jgi:hypothetical protein
VVGCRCGIHAAKAEHRCTTAISTHRYNSVTMLKPQ